jgi:hypothetical protein
MEEGKRNELVRLPY